MKLRFERRHFCCDIQYCVDDYVYVFGKTRHGLLLRSISWGNPRNNVVSDLTNVIKMKILWSWN